MPDPSPPNQPPDPDPSPGAPPNPPPGGASPPANSPPGGDSATPAGGLADLVGYAGKKVVLTGGASGLGAAAVELLAASGCTDLTVLDVKEPTGPATRFIPADMSDPDSIDAAAAEIGGGTDVLFNNAGVAGVHAGDFVLRVNYLGLRRLSETLLPTMGSGGAIVNTASIYGARWPDRLDVLKELIAIEGWDEAVAWILDRSEMVEADSYALSKELVQVWTMHSSHRSLTRFGVRTNSLCPGPIDTPLMADFRRQATEKVIDWAIEQSGGIISPQHMARLLLVLGSDAAAAVNGANLVADRGFSAWMVTDHVDFSALA